MSAPATGIPTPAPSVITFPTASFNEKYPPEPLGHEGSKDARVWTVYRDHVWNRDAKKLDSWNRTVDILLIFAGLFSAVLTAFLIESYQELTEDPSDYMADLLFRVVSNNGSFVFAGTQPGASPVHAPGERFKPSSSALWVNGLWFTSVSLTLSVALLCILAKQWLSEYEDIIFADAPSAHYWTRRHVNHWKGLEKWALPVVVSSVLPSLLHLALFLFFLGLYLFLLPLQGAIATVVAVIGSITLTLYTLPFIIPLWDESCAFRSPLARTFRRWLRLGTHEEDKIVAQSAQLDAEALHWLVSSPDRNIAAAATQAIGSTRPASATAEQLRALGVHRAIGSFMAARVIELSDATIIRNESALVEHMHCVRAMLSVAGAAPVQGATPFTEMQPDLRNRDAQLLNHIVHIFKPRATIALTPSADKHPTFFSIREQEAMLIRALHKHNSEQRDPSTQTRPACHPSTLLMIFDILRIRLARVHGIDKFLEEELEETRADKPDRRRKSRMARAVAIHCEMVVHLVHALSPSNLDHEGVLEVSSHIARCSDALSRTTLPDIRVLPPKHIYHSRGPKDRTEIDSRFFLFGQSRGHRDGTPIESRFLLFAYWVCLSNYSKDLFFTPLTKDVLAQDIAAMIPTIAPVLRSSDLVGLFAAYGHGGNRLDIEEPRTRRALALLINHHAELKLNPFAKFFSSKHALDFSQRNRDFNENLDDILYFLERSNDQPCAWEILHNTICAGGTVNIYVVQLAVALAAALRTRLLERTPAVGIEDQVDAFFAAPFLGPCLRAFCRDYLEFVSDSSSSSSPSKLQGRLKVAFNLLADCAFISADRTAQQMRMEVLIDRPRDGERDSGTLSSTTLTGYIGRIREQDPRQRQYITMHLFQGIPELVSATRLSQLVGPLASGAVAELPRAALEAVSGWDFWSACGLSRHQEILTTSQSLARRILDSEAQTSTVHVPPALLSVIAELCSQDLTSPFEQGSNEALDDKLVADYLTGLGAYRRFSYKKVEGRMSHWIESALLSMQ